MCLAFYPINFVEFLYISQVRVFGRCKIFYILKHKFVTYRHSSVDTTISLIDTFVLNKAPYKDSNDNILVSTCNIFDKHFQRLSCPAQLLSHLNEFLEYFPEPCWTIRENFSHKLYNSKGSDIFRIKKIDVFVSVKMHDFH